MNSTTQVITQHGGPSSESTHDQVPGQSSGREPKDTSGKKFKLPDPKTPPPKPQNEEEFRKTKPTKKQIQAWEDQKKEYKVHNDFKAEIEENWAGNGRGLEDEFLETQDYADKYEAAGELVDLARLIIETDIEPTKRLEAYTRDLQTLSTKYPELKPMFDLNVKELTRWAENKYTEDKPQMQYMFEKEEKGLKTTKTTTKKPATEADDPWTKPDAKRRRDAPSEDRPEEHKFESKETEQLVSVKQAWAEADPLLGQMMREPEQIRGVNGEKLKDINRKIDELISAHTKDSMQEAPDMKIPVAEMILMIIKAVETTVATGRSMIGDKDAEKFFATIAEGAKRMNDYAGGAEKPMQWVANITDVYAYHVKLAEENNVKDLDTMHASPQFWSKELNGWVVETYMASAPRTENIPARFQVVVPDEEMGEADNTPVEIPPASQGSDPLEQFNTTETQVPGAAQTDPVTNEITDGQLPTSSKEQSAQISEDWVTTGYLQDKDGELRRVGGLHKCGTSHQILLRMNEEEEKIAFWHLVGSITAPADRERWIDQGGLVIGAFDRTLTKGLKKYSPSEFVVTGIAVVPRTTGQTYENRGVTLIQGSFSHARFKGKAMPEGHETFERSRFYVISALRSAWGEKTTEAWFNNLMGKNEFRRPVDPEGRKTAEEKKKLMRRRRRLLKGDETLEGSENIEEESDGPLEDNDGRYPDEGDGWVEPAHTHETPKRTPRQDVVQRDDILKMIDEQVDKKLESFNQSFQTNIMPNLIKQFESSMRTLLEQTKPHVM